MFDLFWGADKENPKTIEQCNELIEELGNADFIQALQIHKKWQEFIYTSDPTYTALVPPYNIEISDIGEITLTIKTEN